MSGPEQSYDRPESAKTPSSSEVFSPVDYQRGNPGNRTPERIALEHLDKDKPFLSILPRSETKYDNGLRIKMEQDRSFTIRLNPDESDENWTERFIISPDGKTLVAETRYFNDINDLKKFEFYSIKGKITSTNGGLTLDFPGKHPGLARDFKVSIARDGSFLKSETSWSTKNAEDYPADGLSYVSEEWNKDGSGGRSEFTYYNPKPGGRPYAVPDGSSLYIRGDSIVLTRDAGSPVREKGGDKETGKVWTINLADGTVDFSLNGTPLSLEEVTDDDYCQVSQGINSVSGPRSGSNSSFDGLSIRLPGYKKAKVEIVALLDSDRKKVEAFSIKYKTD